MGNTETAPSRLRASRSIGQICPVTTFHPAIAITVGFPIAANSGVPSPELSPQPRQPVTSLRRGNWTIFLSTPLAIDNQVHRGQGLEHPRAVQRRLDLRGPSRSTDGPQPLRQSRDALSESVVPVQREADWAGLPEVQAVTGRDSDGDAPRDPVSLSLVWLRVVRRTRQRRAGSEDALGAGRNCRRRTESGEAKGG